MVNEINDFYIYICLSFMLFHEVVFLNHQCFPRSSHNVDCKNWKSPHKAVNPILINEYGSWLQQAKS